MEFQVNKEYVSQCVGVFNLDQKWDTTITYIYTTDNNTTQCTFVHTVHTTSSSNTPNCTVATMNQFALICCDAITLEEEDSVLLNERIFEVAMNVRI